MLLSTILHLVYREARVCVCLFDAISIQIAACFFPNSKLILKFKWRCKDPGRAKTSLVKKKLTICDFKKCYKAILFRTS